MTNWLIFDSSAWVAALKRNEEYHDWAADVLRKSTDKFITCEAVVAETCFLMKPAPGGPEKIVGEIANGNVEIGLSVQPEAENVFKLMRKYRDVSMSFADACLVRMSEIYESAAIFTLDSDFLVYRKHRNSQIPVLMPDH